MTVAAPPRPQVDHAPPPLARRWALAGGLLLALVAIGTAAEVAVRLWTGPTPIYQAFMSCGQIGDMRGADQPLVFDTPGTGQPTAGVPSVANIQCVIKALNGPTDWLDSGQPIAATGSQTWGRIRMSWTNRAESGLDVTFTLTD